MFVDLLCTWLAIAFHLLGVALEFRLLSALLSGTKFYSFKIKHLNDRFRMVITVLKIVIWFYGHKLRFTAPLTCRPEARRVCSLKLIEYSRYFWTVPL